MGCNDQAAILGRHLETLCAAVIAQTGSHKAGKNGVQRVPGDSESDEDDGQEGVE
jgi:hypothetical protein